MHAQEELYDVVLVDFFERQFDESLFDDPEDLGAGVMSAAKGVVGEGHLSRLQSSQMSSYLLL